jgi:hypothetical protein
MFEIVFLLFVVPRVLDDGDRKPQTPSDDEGGSVNTGAQHGAVEGNSPRDLLDNCHGAGPAADAMTRFSDADWTSPYDDLASACQSTLGVPL